MTVIQNIQDNNTKHHLWTPEDHLLVAVSGGVDSMVLLHALAELPEYHQPSSIGVVHINHQTREETNQEEEAVTQFAKELGYPVYVKQWIEGSHVTANFEQKARTMRYDFFYQTMQEEQYTVLLTAHHEDDQAETVVMKLIRGGLLEDKLGISYKRPFKEFTLARPLLSVSKSELYDYANSHNVLYFEDATNLENDYSRNRIRNNVMPLLQEENNQAAKHLVEFSNELDDVLTLLRPMLDRIKNDLASFELGNLTITIDQLLQYPVSMQRLILTELLKELFSVEKEFKKQYVKTILNWLNQDSPNSSIDLVSPWKCQRNYNTLVISKESEEHIDMTESFTVNMNEWVSLGENEEFGVFEIDAIRLSQNDFVMSVSENNLHPPFTVRHRKDGDRMTYKGGSGTKKLKDIFINKKISKIDRDKAWVVEDNNNEILWLVGYQESLLSNDLITDKINYIFVYRQLMSED